MKRPHTCAVMVLVVLIISLASACSLTAQKTDSTQIRMTVEEYYDGMAGELKRNPTRLKSLVGQLSQLFEGKITTINGASIQFHVDTRRFKKDHYVTCSFRTTNDVLRLNVGDYVAVQGVLDVAFPNNVPFFDEARSVKLRNCGLVAS